MKSNVQARIEKMERARAVKRWAHSPIEERCDLIASHYCRVANLCFFLKKTVEFNRHLPSENFQDIIAHLYRQIEQDHIATFGVDPAWSIIKTPK